ncbi:RAMP superfamily CRISPR-associated protein [Solwaraspora sp. WMMA2080]|uniref:RAMP superfamily CRISPR-associated protein n=1 Tax=unclassified Solwaraspora TaxID=2627926 RepID=UPI00248BC101|nr:MULTISPECIES: RAMP superfamily CRISPR-associated protein [unclassified Solwaraspora]WBB95009.1 RAMP superfamily CRISPR-associated protein [Solwaraspora sp. WMMA2059]WBC21108.1 RAMP superfamily CRISPR-associated protein [Solwaraspora sp. WMMA2080]
MADIDQLTGSTGLRNEQPFTVEVEFLSDWACGTGTGRHGAVDREVQRDADGLPMLRGKALAAMLRDTAETVAAGLDEGTTGTWHAWVEAVFGSQPGASSRQQLDAGPQPRTMPVPATLQARPLRLAAPVREAIAALDERNQALAREAAVLLRPGVAIDTDRHTAADDTFRIEERAAVGLTVTANWQLVFPGLAADDAVPWEAELLLRAAARLVDAVGGKRRRGAGRCRVTVAGDRASVDGHAGPRLAALLDQVDQAKEPTAAILAGTSADPAGTTLGARATEQLRHRHDLRITALTPLLVARGVIGNMVLTDKYVPGTSLLPMVAKALGRRATELITGGQVVVTNATIEVNGERTLPRPRALHHDKDARPRRPGDPQTLVNIFQPRDDDGRRLRTDDDFCVRAGAEGIHLAQVDLVTQAHAVVDDGTQRPTEDSGGLFVYQAIAAGTVLRCELWLPADAALDVDWLDGEHGIGRSRKDDYGHVKVDVLDPGTPRLAARGEIRTDQQLVVWLLSDLLLRGPAGEPLADATALAAALSTELGVELRLPDPAPGQPPVELATVRRVESWQQRWSMPRPSLTGLAGGSVFRFDMTGVPDESALCRVEAAGIGERTAEGYGRLALQPQLLDQALIEVVKAGSCDVVGELLHRGWHRELHRAAAVRAASAEVRKEFVPPRATAAQLGTLRTLADRVAEDGGPEQIRGWVAATRRNRSRKEIWGGDRLDRLTKLVSGAEALWSYLGVRPPSGIPDELHRQAVGWLLAEVVRAEAEQRRNRPADSPEVNNDEEAPA